MRTKLAFVLAALTATGLALSATQAMADSLHLSVQTNGVTINLNVGEQGTYAPLPPKAKFKPGIYDDGYGGPYPKYMRAQYDEYDDMPPPKHWKKGKFGKFGKYPQYPQYQSGFGDEVMLNPQPLPPRQFHYVNWN